MAEPKRSPWTKPILVVVLLGVVTSLYAIAALDVVGSSWVVPSLPIAAIAAVVVVYVATRPQGERAVGYIMAFVMSFVPMLPVVYGFGMAANASLAGAPVEIRCEVNWKSIRPMKVHYSCDLPAVVGAATGTVEGESIAKLRDKDRFVASARRGALGVWLLDRHSVRPVTQ